MKIEFLYYDKADCRRCASTDMAVKLTLRELKKAVKNSKLKIKLKEKRLKESELRFSPSILINGTDIEKIVNKSTGPKSNRCSDCCQIAGHPVSCRTFSYKGKKYDHIPKEMIMEAIEIIMKTGKSD